MALSSLEIIALIFVLFGIIKLIVVLINKMKWYDGVIKPVYSNSGISSLIILILAIIVLYYLSKELSFAQLFGVLAFIALFMALGFLQYSKETLEFVKKIYNKKITGWLWVYIIFWVILMLLGLYELLY
jgi:hypothetical protein